MKAKLIIGLTLIAAFLALGVFTFVKSQVAAVSIAKARIADRTVQVKGVIDFDTVEYDVEKKRLLFDLYDPESKRSATDGSPEILRVIFYGEVPGNFEQATSVTVIGMSNDEGFVAENMLVKCPSKYQGEDGEMIEGDPEERSYPAST